MLPPRHPLPPPLSPPFRRGGLPSPEPGPNRTCPAFQEENQGRRADENTVRALATSGARLGSRDSLGSSPLHMAALRGHRQVVEALVDLGANVDELGGSGQTPLEVADQAGMAATVALLRRCCHTAAPAVTVADVTPGEVAPSGWLQRGGGRRRFVELGTRRGSGSCDRGDDGGRGRDSVCPRSAVCGAALRGLMEAFRLLLASTPTLLEAGGPAVPLPPLQQK